MLCGREPRRKRDNPSFPHFAYQLPNALLAIRTNDNYLVCQSIGEDAYRTTSVRLLFVSLSSEAVPVQVKGLSDDHWQVQTRTTVSNILNRIPLSHSATFVDYVHSLDPWEEDLLADVDLLVDPYSVCDSLTHGLRAVSLRGLWLDT
jgi:hypothetical protein